MQDIQRLIDAHDGLGLAEQVRQGEVHPRELVEAVIQRLDAVEPALNAVSERLYDHARAAAELPLDPAAPFAGVPTLAKDLFTPLAEARMTNGSLALGEARPGFDSELVMRLRKAGCLFVGTTTSPEFGTSYTTESRRFGATTNPWNTAHSAGGSSGGAAALVAARAVPFAQGNDGGGSLRVPASCCGIFGFKPSRGLMPAGPVMGEGWAGLGTPHAMSLSVRDNAALLDATAGADLGAPYAAPAYDRPFPSWLEHDPRPLRIALIENPSPWANAPEALAAVRHTAQLCESLGHSVVPAALPVDLSAFFDQVFDIIGPSTRHYINVLGQQRGAAVREEELEPITRILLRERGDIPAYRYTAAVEAVHALGRTLAGMLTVFDVILSPTTTREPPPLGELRVEDDQTSLASFIELSHGYGPYTALFNASGQPAMSVPLYWTAQGLPMGSHFAGRFGEEGTLLCLAAQLERAQPWAGRVPGLSAVGR
ncbi:amidase [Pseudomonas sp. KNUC1026]|uniref:amidase n=1 Tax=Pseudomonas sp. KNUC1026 TaxID=2893890 RepID=UPI001F25EE9B|nr:amidase [Pseudomonas sp. KNUC1026]UFH48310.1 amidase [Pseudomonas sp. KNUC1026]